MRHAARIVVAAVIALVVLAQGINAPFEKDQEPQSAQWIVDVVGHGHWLTPVDYYGNVNRKPPLFYWLAALVTIATGGHVDEVRARLVSLVAAVALAVGVMLWSCAYLGEASGWLAFCFLLGTYGFASRATLALTDMLLTLLVFAAYCMTYPMMEGVESARRALSAGVILGLGILTKGPVALVLCALAVIVYLPLTGRRPWAPLARAWPWLMLITALAVAAAWYAPAFILGRRDLVDVFMAENFGHFMPSRMGGTGEASRPIYYIVARMLGGALPLCFLVPALFLAFFVGRTFSDARKPVLFQLGLVLAVVVFFTAASSKRDDYILPALPSLAILLAVLFRAPAAVPGGGTDYAAQLRDITAGVIAIAVVTVIAAAFVFVKTGGTVGALHLRLNSIDASYAAMFADGLGRLPLPFASLIVAMASGAVMVFVALYGRMTAWTGAGLALLSIAGVVLWTSILRPEVARTRSLKWFAAEVHRQIGAAPLYVVAGEDPELSFYYGRAIPALGSGGGPDLAASGPVYLFARQREMGELAPAYREHLKPVLQGHTVGGGGPPAVFLLTPAGTSGRFQSATGRARRGERP